VKSNTIPAHRKCPSICERKSLLNKTEHANNLGNNESGKKDTSKKALKVRYSQQMSKVHKTTQTQKNLCRSPSKNKKRYVFPVLLSVKSYLSLGVFLTERKVY